MPAPAVESYIIQGARRTAAHDVQIGANTTIDRGTLNDTVIEDGVKLDNLIQIAHNVSIGAHTAIAARELQWLGKLQRGDPANSATEVARIAAETTSRPPWFDPATIERN